MTVFATGAPGLAFFRAFLFTLILGSIITGCGLLFLCRCRLSLVQKQRLFAVLLACIGILLTAPFVLLIVL